MTSVHIRGGRLVDPDSGLDETADLFVQDGRIAAHGKKPRGFSADIEIDAGAGLVVPGLVDLCARFREPGLEHKGTIASEARAAASAGVTTVCCPPDTDPVIDTTAVAELIQQRAAACGQTRVLPLGALTRGLRGENLAEMDALRRAGCVAVSNADRPIPDSEVLRRAMEYAAGCGLRVFIQPEDHFLRNQGVVHEGAVSTRLGLPPIPAAAETVAVSRALLLMEQTGAAVHFCRLSAARSVELLANARRAGLPVSADVGISHLFLTESDVNSYDTNAHLRPPLRTREDRDALRRAVAEGVIDAICSDHQPHDLDAKAAPFSLTEPGASTVELLLPLLLELVRENALPLSAALAAATSKPAHILGLQAGTLKTGAPADITVIDPERSFRVAADTLLSSGKNTPFLNRTFRGKVTHTLIGGRLVFGSAGGS